MADLIASHPKLAVGVGLAEAAFVVLASRCDRQTVEGERLGPVGRMNGRISVWLLSWLISTCSTLVFVVGQVSAADGHHTRVE